MKCIIRKGILKHETLKDTTIMKSDHRKILAAHFVKDNKYQQCETSVVCEYRYRFTALLAKSRHVLFAT